MQRISKFKMQGRMSEDSFFLNWIILHHSTGVTRMFSPEGLKRPEQSRILRELSQTHSATLARKPESKNFDALASVIHQKNRIGSGFPGMCDFKSVHGA